MVTKHAQKKVNVKTEKTKLIINMPNGTQHHITVSQNGYIIVHAYTGATKEVCIGFAEQSFKVSELNENGSIYSIKKSS